MGRRISQRKIAISVALEPLPGFKFNAWVLLFYFANLVKSLSFPQQKGQVATLTSSDRKAKRKRSTKFETFLRVPKNELPRRYRAERFISLYGEDGEVDAAAAIEKVVNLRSELKLVP